MRSVDRNTWNCVNSKMLKPKKKKHRAIDILLQVHCNLNTQRSCKNSICYRTLEVCSELNKNYPLNL